MGWSMRNASKGKVSNLCVEVMGRWRLIEVKVDKKVKQMSDLCEAPCLDTLTGFTTNEAFTPMSHYTSTANVTLRHIEANEVLLPSLLR